MAAATAGMLASSCSSDGRRDQFYGRDVGVIYRPPEAAAPREAGSAETALGDGRSPDAGADVATADLEHSEGSRPPAMGPDGQSLSSPDATDNHSD